MPDVAMPRIQHLAIIQLQSSQATENLGLLAPPDGNPAPQFEVLRGKVDDWTAKIRDGHLPARSNWLSYQCQLWPGLKYGLGASSATIEQLEKGLGSRDHKLLGLLGICRNIPTELRYLPSCFGGFALRCLKFDATTEAINSFYSTTGPNSWIKSLWERLQHFDIDLQIDYDVLPMPRTNDECIMERCVEEGVRGAELASINRVRKYQEALFLSDIVTADGKKLEETYLQDWRQSIEYQFGKHRSQFEFGTECPLDSDWVTWSNYWNRQCHGCPYHRLPCGLGGLRAASPGVKEENLVGV
ncbi:hypothetical protein THAOC_06066 [Thalassiosira oceanica]|uniref:Uncharacterized protein n=1 Tax=Thalassiosira oceanica TaxID=159749 RepID=K0TFN3_THAOC|nr:hypothetical protein THAOC_06066 [Thalassiosira oceanica]|eukprot:EJK72406.1 hypothetical protein THAOC_06066 [Thalassiosira oceanica]